VLGHCDVQVGNRRDERCDAGRGRRFASDGLVVASPVPDHITGPGRGYERRIRIAPEALEYLDGPSVARSGGVCPAQ